MKTNFLKDNEGNFSSTRLAYMLLILNAIGMGWVAVANGEYQSAVLIVAGVAGVAGSIKANQKASELKNQKEEK